MSAERRPGDGYRFPDKHDVSFFRVIAALVLLFISVEPLMTAYMCYVNTHRSPPGPQP